MDSQTIDQRAKSLLNLIQDQPLNFIPMTDPGDGGTLSPSYSGYCEITPAAVDDVMTLSLPAFVGQEITLYCIDGTSGTTRSR